MDKKIKIAALLVLFLGSFQAIAMNIQDNESLNPDETIIAEFENEQETEKISLTMKAMIEEGQQHLNQIIQLFDQIDASRNNISGLVKFLGQREFLVDSILSEMRELEQASKTMTLQELEKASEKMAQSLKKIRKLNLTAQQTVDKVLLGK